MGYIRLQAIAEYLVEPLRRCCTDTDPYVRKTAAICIAKLYGETQLQPNFSHPPPAPPPGGQGLRLSATFRNLTRGLCCEGKLLPHSSLLVPLLLMTDTLLLIETMIIIMHSKHIPMHCKCRKASDIPH